MEEEVCVTTQISLSVSSFYFTESWDYIVMFKSNIPDSWESYCNDNVLPLFSASQVLIIFLVRRLEKARTFNGSVLVFASENKCHCKWVGFQWSFSIFMAFVLFVHREANNLSLTLILQTFRLYKLVSSFSLREVSLAEHYFWKWRLAHTTGTQWDVRLTPHWSFCFLTVATCGKHEENFDELADDLGGLLDDYK